MNIVPLLDIEDLIADPIRVDEKSVMTYVSEFLKYFNSEVNLMKEIDREFSRLECSIQLKEKLTIVTFIRSRLMAEDTKPAEAQPPQPVRQAGEQPLQSAPTLH